MGEIHPLFYFHKKGKDENMKMKNEVYDVLKWVALIVLPAVATFMLLMGETWSISYAQQIATTITGVGTLLGACLQVSSANYHEGE